MLGVCSRVGCRLPALTSSLSKLPLFNTMPTTRRTAVTVHSNQVTEHLDAPKEGRAASGSRRVQQATVEVEAEVKQKVKRPRATKAAKKQEQPLAARALNGSEAAQQAPTEAEAEPKPKAKRQRKPPAIVYPVYSADMRPPPCTSPAMRILSWNVGGLRGLLTRREGALQELIESQEADVVCLQEVKLQDKHVEDIEPRLALEGWHRYWSCSQEKLGYSGTAIFSRIKPISVQMGIGRNEHDQEGRVIAAEYPDFYLVNTYVPNSGDGLKRLTYRTGEAGWDIHFSTYLQMLGQQKPVVLTGDLNCAHQEIDIHAPKRNLRSAGFTQEERDSFSKHLIGAGLVDAFRQQHPEVTGYTFWSWRQNARTNNKGWRLDYFLVSQGLMEQVHDCYHLDTFLGSDHCPIGLVVKIKGTPV